MAAFLDKVLAPILQRNVNERVLVFTEYRGTQAYIVEQLAQRYGDDKVNVDNGSLNVDERLRSFESFEQHGQFFVSTDAIGAVINMHRSSHILVTYVLPLTPMRLAHAEGRPYT